jgi:hypothetical protein
MISAKLYFQHKNQTNWFYIVTDVHSANCSQNNNVEVLREFYDTVVLSNPGGYYKVILDTNNLFKLPITEAEVLIIALQATHVDF